MEIWLYIINYKMGRDGIVTRCCGTNGRCGTNGTKATGILVLDFGIQGIINRKIGRIAIFFRYFFLADSLGK